MDDRNQIPRRVDVTRVGKYFRAISRHATIGQLRFLNAEASTSDSPRGKAPHLLFVAERRTSPQGLRLVECGGIWRVLVIFSSLKTLLQNFKNG